MEAEGSVGNEAGFVVHAFEARVRESGVDKREDALEVPAHGTSETDEGCEAGALSPCKPGAEGSASVVAAGVGEEIEEGLLQQVGPIERVIGSTYELELETLAGPKVLRVLEQGPPRALDRFSVFWIEPAPTSGRSVFVAFGRCPRAPVHRG